MEGKMRPGSQPQLSLQHEDDHWPHELQEEIHSGPQFSHSGEEEPVTVHIN